MDQVNSALVTHVFSCSPKMPTNYLAWEIQNDRVHSFKFVVNWIFHRKLALGSGRKKQLSHVLLALYCCVNGILREVEEEEILHF